MSFENYCWWHLILTCRGQWLPGDPRGFRSREHRIHSSGDYKRCPPAGEHAELHRYQQNQSDDAIAIPETTRARLGQAILRKSVNINAPCLVIAAGKAHTHLLVALMNDWQHVRREAGRLKQAGSHAIREVVPGRVWGDGGKPIRILDREHQQHVFRYICEHIEESAWVWRYDKIEQPDDPDLRCAQDRLLKALLEGRAG